MGRDLYGHAQLNFSFIAYLGYYVEIGTSKTLQLLHKFTYTLFLNRNIYILKIFLFLCSFELLAYTVFSNKFGQAEDIKTETSA